MIFQISTSKMFSTRLPRRLLLQLLLLLRLLVAIEAPVVESQMRPNSLHDGYRSDYLLQKNETQHKNDPQFHLNINDNNINNLSYHSDSDGRHRHRHHHRNNHPAIVESSSIFEEDPASDRLSLSDVTEECQTRDNPNRSSSETPIIEDLLDTSMTVNDDDGCDNNGNGNERGRDRRLRQSKRSVTETSADSVGQTPSTNISKDDPNLVSNTHPLPRSKTRKTQLCCKPGHELIVVPLIFCAVIIVGCLGNVLVIAVVFKNKNQLSNTTNTFIVNLAVADLIFLVFCVPFHALVYSATVHWPLGSHVCKLVHYLQFTSMITSIWTLVLMSLDRFLAVAYPIQTKHLRTSRSALAVCLIIWFSALMSAIPIGMAYGVRVYTHNIMGPAISSQNASRLLGFGNGLKDFGKNGSLESDWSTSTSNKATSESDINLSSNFTPSQLFQSSYQATPSWHVITPTNHVGASNFSTTPSSNRSKSGYLINTTLCAESWGKASSKGAYYAFLLATSYLIPLLFIAGLNCTTIGYLWRGSFDMGTNQQGRSTDAKRRGTKLIVAIVIVFALMWLPSHVIWMWTNFFKSTWRNNYFFYYFKIFAHVSSYANSCANPAVYAFLSTRFRRELRTVLPCSRYYRRSKAPRNARFTFTTAGKSQISQETNRLSQLNHHHQHHRLEDHHHQHHHQQEGTIYLTTNSTISTNTVSSLGAVCGDVCRECGKGDRSKGKQKRGLNFAGFKNRKGANVGVASSNSTLSMRAMRLSQTSADRQTGASHL